MSLKLTDYSKEHLAGRVCYLSPLCHRVVLSFIESEIESKSKNVQLCILGSLSYELSLH